jgi:hypothetical protein
MRRLAAARWPGLVLMLAGLPAFLVYGTAWAFLAFAVGATWVIGTLWSENRRLRAAAEPRLSLRFRPAGGPTDLYDSYHFLRNGDTWRYCRVAIVNTGASAPATVKLAALSPEQYPVFPMQAFARTGQGGSTIVVHKSAGGPTDFVDVISQKVAGQRGATSEMRLEFAAGSLAIPLSVDRYRLSLAIEGPGAEAPQHFELSRNAEGQYDLIELG